MAIFINVSLKNLPTACLKFTTARSAASARKCRLRRKFSPRGLLTFFVTNDIIATIGVGIKTKSGSWYYLECVPKLGGQNHWRMKTLKGDFWVCGLRKADKTIIRYPKITHAQLFFGCEVFYEKELLDQGYAAMRKTSPVEEVIGFQ